MRVFTPGWIAFISGYCDLRSSVLIIPNLNYNQISPPPCPMLWPIKFPTECMHLYNALCLLYCWCLRENNIGFMRFVCSQQHSSGCIADTRPVNCSSTLKVTVNQPVFSQQKSQYIEDTVYGFWNMLYIFVPKRYIKGNKLNALLLNFSYVSWKQFDIYTLNLLIASTFV